jgi:hypothetical protein
VNVAEPGNPAPPPLPATLPADLRDFVECRSTTATIANGPVTWVEIPPSAKGLLGGGDVRPMLTVAPGTRPGTAILEVKVGWVTVSLPASVVAGRLAIDTSRLPFLAPRSIADGIRRFTDDLNGWLAANGWALGDPSFGPAGMTLTKVPLQPAG